MNQRQVKFLSQVKFLNFPEAVEISSLINILRGATIHAARICSSIERIGELLKPKQRFVPEMPETVLTQPAAKGERR